MKKTVFALSLGLAAALGFVMVTPLFNVAEAGVEPSPFQPEINQLGAVANILHSADFRIAKSIAHPPDPCVPPEPCNSPDLNGAVNRLGAIENQVSSADDMVKAMIEEVMGFEPTPFRAVDLIPALEVVGDAGDLIADGINDYLYEPPAGIPDAYLGALSGVAEKALDVAASTARGVDYIRSHTWIDCPAIEDELECKSYRPLCMWVPEPVGRDPYCDFIAP